MALIFTWRALFDGDRVAGTTKVFLRKAKAKHRIGIIGDGGFEHRKNLLESTGILRYFTSIVIDDASLGERIAQCMEEIEGRPDSTVVICMPDEVGAVTGSGCMICSLGDSQAGYAVDRISDLKRIL